MLPNENAETPRQRKAEAPGLARYPARWPLYTAPQAARLLAGREAPATALGQFKGAHDRGYIRREHPGERPGEASRHGLDDVAVLAALTPLWALGVSDRHISTAASTALYEWRPGQVLPDDYPDCLSPIIAAMYGSQRGELWSLHVRLLRLPNGRGHIGAIVHDSDHQPTMRGLPDGTAPVGNLHVHLTEALLRLTHALPDGRH